MGVGGHPSSFRSLPGSNCGGLPPEKRDVATDLSELPTQGTERASGRSYSRAPATWKLRSMSVLVWTSLVVGACVADPGSFSYVGYVDPGEADQLCIRPDRPAKYRDNPWPVQDRACGQAASGVALGRFPSGTCVRASFANFPDPLPPEGKVVWLSAEEAPDGCGKN